MFNLNHSALHAFSYAEGASLLYVDRTRKELFLDETSSLDLDRVESVVRVWEEAYDHQLKEGLLGQRFVFVEKTLALRFALEYIDRALIQENPLLHIQNAVCEQDSWAHARLQSIRVIKPQREALVSCIDQLREKIIEGFRRCISHPTIKTPQVIHAVYKDAYEIDPSISYAYAHAHLQRWLEEQEAKKTQSKSLRTRFIVQERARISNTRLTVLVTKVALLGGLILLAKSWSKK